MSVLIIGKNGQVARALAKRAAARGMSVTVAGRPEFDLAKFYGELPTRANAVINAAAYTQVDRAEDETELASRINGSAVGALARASSQSDVFIHLSTDYVFAGDKPTPYVETDPVAPNNAYGVSKLTGEQAALENNQRSVILRTAWVYDGEGANFVRTMLRLAKSRDEINVVADQHGCPTFAPDLADAALTIAAKPGAFGVFHCVGGGATTWAGFAEEIFRQSQARGGPSAAVKHISSAEFPVRAKRPANSRLDCSKLEGAYGIYLRPWRSALADCMDQIAQSGWSVE